MNRRSNFRDWDPKYLLKVELFPRSSPEIVGRSEYVSDALTQTLGIENLFQDDAAHQKARLEQTDERPH